MKNNLPRILISACNSGSGKTTIVCGLLKALKNRGLNVASFKCGPDYIDTMFHTRAIGVDSKNLDGFFCDEQLLRTLFYKQGKNRDINIIEGAMGYYDGMSMDSCEASTYTVGKSLKAPTILVLNGKGMALTVIAVLKGIIEFKADSNIVGVIINNTSEAVYNRLKPVIENQLNIKALGFMPYNNACQLESRHLGLVTPQDMENIDVKLTELGKLAEKYIDIDEIIKIADNSSLLDISDEKKSFEDKKVRLAVAYDKAFCFYYKDNLELLESMGCELVYFSPLEDTCLPQDIDGLILGGGYPELYLEKLSKNKKMLSAVKNAVENNIPCLAECGGFMYLHSEIEDKQGRAFKMADVIKGRAVYKNRLVRFGYINLTNKKYNLKAHEFHYWDSTDNGNCFMAEKPDGRKWECMVEYKNLVCGFPHIFYYSDTNFIQDFVKRCKQCL